jgi:hypothetical protein
MDQVEQAKAYAQDFIKTNPDLANEVNELFTLMCEEIQDGESPDNELELFISSCDELLEFE